MPAPPGTIALSLATAGSALAALGGLQDHRLALPAAALAGAIGVACALRVAPAGLGAAAPALALLPGGSLLALAGFAVGGCCAAIGGAALGAASDPDALRAAAEARAIAAERARLQATLERYPMLLEACLELSSARDPDVLAQSLLARARALVPGAAAILVFLGTASRQRCCASIGADGVPCPREARAEELYVAAEARSLTDRHQGRMRVYIPLRADRRQGDGAESSRGVLVIELGERSLASRPELELVHALGRLGGMGLATVDLVDQQRSLALHDDLTGLYGQHEFLRRLDEQVAHSRRHKHPLGVLMCDLDHLKKFNDRWGHAAGDLALVGVARCINAQLTAGAIACRYGGEEFALVVPDLDLKALAAFAEKLRAAIAGTEADPEHPERVVTASIGYALLEGEEDGRGALARADAAGYRAKHAGRNRTEAAT